MSIISLIAAVDENGGLGHDNKLLCHLPADLQHFKEITLSKPILMGRKTCSSIGRALPGRLNIVISSTLNTLQDVMVVRSLTDALNAAKDAEEIMIIGGAKIFEQTLSIAQRIYLTLIHHSFQADTFFPPIDLKQWQCTRETYRSKDEKNPYDLTFYNYERIKKGPGY